MPPTYTPWQFWTEKLSSPKCIVAPMVDASELAWRLLSRKYGAHLAYTPMLHAAMFVRDARYRRENLASCAEDRPLIIQFCANDPEILLEAARLVVGHCDGIDLNLGCPQAIAKKGHYGSYLQDEWELISKMVKTVHENLDIPITCKVRVFEDMEKTIAYARMLEDSGCYALTVHGRTREQKGPMTGLASWAHIKAVKEAVKIPVIANGNIQYLADVDRCIAATGVDGVMSAEGNLTNPAIFAGIQPLAWEMAEEYLQLVEKYPCPLSYVRGHLFKIFHHCLVLEECSSLRDALARGSTLSDLKQMTNDLKEHFLPYHTGDKQFNLPCKLSFMPWICQPYVRPPPEEYQKKMELVKETLKRTHEEVSKSETEGPQLSKKKQKKLQRKPNKTFGVAKEETPKCGTCPNPLGGKCCYGLCRKCCRERCFTQNLDCEGHNIFIRRKRERAQHKDAETPLANTAILRPAESVPS